MIGQHGGKAVRTANVDGCIQFTDGAREIGLAPILMRRDEAINLKNAVHLTGRSEKTIRIWCHEFGIGVQACPGAPLEISAPALEMVRHGDMVALELLRQGKRNHERVRRYFDHLGLSI